MSQTSNKELVHWCNGSTSDSGSASLGSSPGWTTKKAPQRVLQGFFLCQGLFLYPFHLPRVFAAVGVGVCPDEPFIVQSFNIEGKPAAGVGQSFLLYQVGIIDGPLVG